MAADGFEFLPLPALLLALALLVLNLVVTTGLVRDAGLSIGQRFGQAVIVWLLPFLGALLILFVQGMSHTRDEMKSLVPFPFYLAGYNKVRPNPHRDEYGSAVDPPGESFGEGSCGSD